MLDYDMELCKAVYDLTGWGDYDTDVDNRLRYRFSRGPYAGVPMYSIDFLLDKLPGCMPGLGDFRLQYGYRRGISVFEAAFGTTVAYSENPLCALLNLIVELSEIGLLEKYKSNFLEFEEITI